MNLSLSHDQKRKRLQSLNEDAFRDTVIRPLFKLQGLRSYRDLCGIDEEGKDCIMLKDAEFGSVQVYAIQTKTVKLNMTRKATESVVEAITQLRTCLSTPVPLISPPLMRKPDVVYLCASGSANTAARRHINDELKDSRIRIMDADDVIEALDEHYPSFWLNISYTKRRYLEAFRSHLLRLSDAVFLTAGSDKPTLPPFAEEAYVGQRLYRMTTHMTVKQGQINTNPRLEEIEDSKLLTSQNRVAFITGDGGSGKTTLLRRMALQVCEGSLAATGPDSCYIPVLVRCLDLLHVDDLTEHVQATVASFTGDRDSGPEDQDYQSGRVFLFIDAVDELSARTAIEHAIGLIDKFKNAHPTCRVYATTRHLIPVRSYTTAAEVPLYDIADFSIRQAQRIVRRAAEGQAMSESACTEVLRRLQDVHGMKLSPLLVTVFAATPNFQTADIPPNLTSIFRKFAGLMLGQWDQQKGLSQQYEWEIKHGILESVALKWHSTQVVDAAVDEFSDDVRSLLEKVGQSDKADSLSQEILRSGLLVIEGDRVAFRHLLFQEYFAGCAIETVHDIENVAAVEWWRNAIVFSYGNRPKRGDELIILTRSVEESLKGRERHHAAITIGLALQACYLTNIDQRLEAFAKVLAMLASSFAECLRQEENASDYPINAFIYDFLQARSAVSTDLVMKTALPVVNTHSVEFLQFLKLAGAIESGNIVEVSDEAIAFAPEDQRLLLGIHILCFFVQNLRVSTGGERAAAGRIASSIGPRIQPLIRQVFEEFRGMVMEFQGGTVKVIDAPLATPEGQFEMPLDFSE